jgi:hypothetical protein
MRSRRERGFRVACSVDAESIVAGGYLNQNETEA